MVYVMVRARAAAGLARRITGLCEFRGYALQGFSAGPAERGLVRFTLAVAAPPDRASLLARQLQRLADVIAVEVAAGELAVSRELALIKVCPPPGRRPEVFQVAEVFRARVVDADPGALVIEVTGTAGKIEALIALLHEFNVVEVARSGPVTLRRGSRAPGVEVSAPGPEAQPQESGARVAARDR